MITSLLSAPLMAQQTTPSIDVPSCNFGVSPTKNPDVTAGHGPEHRRSKLQFRRLPQSRPFDDARTALTSLREHYLQHLFDPARTEDLASTIGVEISLIEKLQSFLIDRGEVIRIATDVALSAEAVPQAAQKLAVLFEKEGAFTASQAKDALGTTRMFAIPLLEHLDKTGWTRRKGDRREIRSEKLEE